MGGRLIHGIDLYMGKYGSNFVTHCVPAFSPKSTWFPLLQLAHIVLVACRKFVKTKRSHHSTFLYCPTNCFSMSKKITFKSVEHHKYYTPKMILKTWQDILCFHEIAMRANPWPVLLNRDPHTVLVLPFVVLISGKQQTLSCFGEFSTVQGECKYNTVYFTLWHFQVPSGTFKHFQTLSGATRIARSHARMQWLPPLLYNPYRRFKQLNVVFWDVKALAQAALITLVGAGCVGFCEENLLAKQSPEKVTRDLQPKWLRY